MTFCQKTAVKIGDKTQDTKNNCFANKANMTNHVLYTIRILVFLVFSYLFRVSSHIVWVYHQNNKIHEAKKLTKKLIFNFPAPKPVGRRSRKPGLDRKPRQAYSAKQLERLESEFKVKIF